MGFDMGYPMRRFQVCLLGDQKGPCLARGYRCPMVVDGNTFIEVVAQSEGQARRVVNGLAPVVGVNDITDLVGVW